MECARAIRGGLRFRPVSASKCREGALPVPGRGPLDGPHLTKIGLTATAVWTLHTSGAAGWTPLHAGYSR